MASDESGAGNTETRENKSSCKTGTMISLA